MRKVITILLIFIITFTAIPFNRVCASTVVEGQGPLTMEMKNEFDEGKYDVLTQDSDLTTSTDNNLIANGLASLIIIIPLSVQSLMTLAIQSATATSIQMFTIEDLLMNRFELFNINFLKNSIIDIEVYPSELNVIFGQNVAKWFSVIRNFAIVALLAILIYIGILMSISTIASEKAKYKEMLVHWFVSFAILMLLPYIMSILFSVSDVCISTIKKIAELLVVKVNNSLIEPTKGLNFEKTLLYGKATASGYGYDGILTLLFSSFGWNTFPYVFVYCVLVYYQVKFFFMYLKRVFTVGFLVIISPLITITYSIDKAGDNKAQAYNKWLTEFLINIFIQPLHLFVFVVFMYSTYGIMERAPIFAIVFLASLTRAEKIVRRIFKINGKATFRGLGKGK